MLTAPERVVFLFAVLASGLLALRAALRLWRVIHRGRDSSAVERPGHRLGSALFRTITLQPAFRTRPLTGLFHALVAWGFMLYLLVNIGDGLEGYRAGFEFGGSGRAGDVYRLAGDLLSVGVLAGMAALLIRRFLLRPPEMDIRQTVLLLPEGRRGIRRDSAIVGGFILLHVGGRFFGESFAIAAGGRDPWRPFATLVSGLWSGLGERPLTAAEHAAWWLALGLILLFVPYFPRSKHIHIFLGPLNLLLKPPRRAPRPMEALRLDGGPLGARRLEELTRSQLLDAYACIQCNRCQAVCPAYAAGTALSPAALEINKRYRLNQEAGLLAAGGASSEGLVEFALTPDATWACTTCGACAEVCPVGNEPVRDILDLRRGLVLNEGALPARGAAVLRRAAVAGNPWGEAPSARAGWAEGLGIRTMREAGSVDVLYWVGCSAAYDARNQAIARAVARLLQRAGVDFAILGDEEACTGDPARRMGDEALFQRLACRNIGTLSRYAFRRIVTHCPHCLNVLRHEYPALVDGAGRGWTVLHHTQLLDELLAAGLLRPQRPTEEMLTFHDPCYLGRYQGEFDAPRRVLAALPGVQLREMPRTRANSFCCGGGGGASWIDVPAERRVADVRLREALDLQTSAVASACPFCLTMFEGSAVKRTTGIQLRDVAEILDAATTP